MNTPAEELIASLKPVRNRGRPLTAEGLEKDQMITCLRFRVATLCEDAADMQSIIARHPKWDALIAVTAFLAGGLLGRVIQ